MVTLKIEARGETPADLVRMALRHLEDFAGGARDGGEAKAVFRAWTRDDEVAKLTERRDRWRKRAELAESNEAYLLEANKNITRWWGNARDQLAERTRERDEARALVSGLLQTANRECDKANAEAAEARAEACNLRAEIEKLAQLREKVDPLGQVFRDCGYTKVEGNRDLLSAIHGCLEGIRADLRRSLEARR